MNLRRTAMTLAMGGVALTLIGVGVGASFSDSATAKANISVGTFGITINSTTAGAVVTNTGSAGTGDAVHTVTFTAQDIQSSQAGTSPLQFTITSNGSIPANVTVVASASGISINGPFSDMLVNPGPVTLNNGGQKDYSGGIAWSTLSNSNLGSSVSITYTVTAASAS